MSPYQAVPSDGIAWITGASSGLGYHVAKRLVAVGWTVAATARSADELETLAAECAGMPGRVVPAAGDVTDQAAMGKIAENLIAKRNRVRVDTLIEHSAADPECRNLFAPKGERIET